MFIWDYLLNLDLKIRLKISSLLWIIELTFELLDNYIIYYNLGNEDYVELLHCKK